ncbi:hypothetical protein P8452_47274 [Trifolium repens]|nr:hypothetical protein P8452_47274 [Trifolium repens]
MNFSDKTEKSEESKNSDKSEESKNSEEEEGSKGSDKEPGGDKEVVNADNYDLDLTTTRLSNRLRPVTTTTRLSPPTATSLSARPHHLSLSPSLFPRQTDLIFALVFRACGERSVSSLRS